MNLLVNELYREDLANIVQYIDFDSDKSILVTGASGLIGSLIVDALLYYNEKNKNQHLVRVYAMARNKEKLEKRFQYWKGSLELSLLSEDICNPLPDELYFDFIFHAASNADPGTYAVYPVETIKTNVLGTIQVLEYARRHKGTKVLFTSTMEVYGKMHGKDMMEEQDYGLININSVRSGYPESKRVSELLCRSYVDEYGLDVVITRLGYIYGPTMTATDNKVVAQFIRNGVKQEDIVLKSKGMQRRSYCYVADAVAGMLCVLFWGEKGEVYNIANKDSVVTIAEMAQIIADIAGTEVVYSVPDSIEIKGSSDPQDAVLSTEKLETLHWKPHLDMHNGLKRTLMILGKD